MTRKSDEPDVVRKIVVFFDICSSTSILEDLVRTDNQKLWRDLLIELKDFLRKKRRFHRFTLYKFLGDGWILLFEPRADGLPVFEFLEDLSEHFLSLYRRHVKRVLTVRIPALGITAGMDIGPCMRFVMNGQIEYAGRPLNVAARLQSTVGQRDKKPWNKTLVSNNLYATFDDRQKIQRKYKIWDVTRVLKNISGGERYYCKKVERRSR
jgi:class 3 adenylate cyclase